LEAVHFSKPAALKEQYPSCKIIDGKTVVFKIRGNRYRLTASVAYNMGVVNIVAVETHAEYDRRRL
jgi:mRNA interferase HigB